MLHVMPIQLLTIWNPKRNCVSYTDHRTTHYAFFSGQLPAAPIQPQIFPPPLFSNTIKLDNPFLNFQVLSAPKSHTSAFYVISL
jgi:hypothetical protein